MRYKYIGPDDDAPGKTTFMGRVKFKLNKASEVTDPLVLSKIKNHPSFKLVKDKEKKVVPKKVEPVAEKATRKPRRTSKQMAEDRAKERDNKDAATQ